MKKLVCCLCLLISSIVVAQPPAFNYQGVLRHADGKPVDKEPVTIVFTIIDAGQEVYAERHEARTDPLGLFQRVIGEGTVLKGNFKDIAWASGQKELKIEFTAASGERFPPQTIRLLSVPYALYAEKSGSPVDVKEGTGIRVGKDGTAYTVINTGDTNPDDDLLKIARAGGDLSGTFENLQINPEAVTGSEIRNGAVTPDKLAPATPADDGKVLKWKDNKWQILDDSQGTPIPGSNPIGPASGDLTGNYPGPQIQFEAVTTQKIKDGEVKTADLENGAVTADKLGIPGTAAGQVLKWNAAAGRWEPGTDAIGTPGSEVVLEEGTNVTIEKKGVNQFKINATGTGTGGVASVTGTTPINVTPGNTPVVSVATADGATAGVLSPADYNTFKGKEDKLNFLAPLIRGAGNTVTADADAPLWNAKKLLGREIDPAKAPSDKDVLTWNSATGKWEPNSITAAPGGGLTAVNPKHKFVPRFRDASTLENSIVFSADNALGIGTEDPKAKLHLKDGALLVDGSTGPTPVAGAGTRLMWIPEKAAFRAGTVSGTTGFKAELWDAKNIGEGSVALGLDVLSTGLGSVAMGRDSRASGQGATAIGNTAWAKEQGSTALGWAAVATGRPIRGGATAIGTHVYAVGEYNIIIGTFATTLKDATKPMPLAEIAEKPYSDGFKGCFMVTDAQGGDAGDLDGPGEDTYQPVRYLFAERDNQFIARFKGGYKFYTSSDRSTGVQFEPGQNSPSVVSDVRKKENFKPIQGEDFLNRISAFTLATWNYKGQDARQYRHYGPTAQDFFAAFGNDGVGKIGSDTTIVSSDLAGVNFTAIQALVKRTEELRRKDQQLEQKARELDALLEKLEAQRVENERLRAEVSAQQVKSEKLESDLEAVKRHLGLNLKARDKD